MFQRLWTFFWKPSTRWGTGIVAVCGAIIALVLWAGFDKALEHTNRTEFCVSCHEMNANSYQEYQKTVHFRNPSGVRAGCPDCHVPKSFGPKLMAKFKASRDVWGHLTGIIDTPEKYEDHRLEMATRVWRYMESTNSRECRSCHDFPAMDVGKQRAEAQKMHPTAIKDNETCISCHKGIAHTLPDMSGSYKKMFEALEKQATAEGAKADVLYPIKEIPIYAEKDMGKTGGTILPATALKVLERSGDVLKVSLSGWQQDGVNSAVYARRGKRIFEAALTSSMVERLQASEAETDPETDLVWRKVSLEGWVKKDALVSKLQPIWDYGAEMYSANCNTCHKSAAPDHNLANQWNGVVEAMQRFVTIDKQQNRFMVKYLQMHASDVGGAAH